MTFGFEIIGQPIEEEEPDVVAAEKTENRAPQFAIRKEFPISGRVRSLGALVARLPGSRGATMHQGTSQSRLAAPMMRNMPRQESHVIIFTPRKRRAQDRLSSRHRSARWPFRAVAPEN